MAHTKLPLGTDVVLRYFGQLKPKSGRESAMYAAIVALGGWLVHLQADKPKPDGTTPVIVNVYQTQTDAKGSGSVTAPPSH